MAEQSKKTSEVWAAGIGRKSNAQYGSDLMVEVFGDAGKHARSAVGVASLPEGITVEIEGIFRIR